MKGTVTMKGKRYYPVFDIGRDPANGKRRQKWGPGFKTKRVFPNFREGIRFLSYISPYFTPFTCCYCV